MNVHLPDTMMDQKLVIGSIDSSEKLKTDELYVAMSYKPIEIDEDVIFNLEDLYQLQKDDIVLLCEWDDGYSSKFTCYYVWKSEENQLWWFFPEDEKEMMLTDLHIDYEMMIGLICQHIISEYASSIFQTR